MGRRVGAQRCVFDPAAARSARRAPTPAGGDRRRLHASDARCTAQGPVHGGHRMPYECGLRKDLQPAVRVLRHLRWEGRRGPGLLVRQFCEDTARRTVPPCLAFAFGRPKEAQSANYRKLRNPSRAQFRFPQLRPDSRFHTAHLMRANWLLRGVLGTARWPCSTGEDGFHELAAGLFMVGYDLSERTAGPPGPAVDQQPEIPPMTQTRPAQPRRIEHRAQPLHKGIEPGLLQDLVQPFTKGMSRARRKVRCGHPHRRRLSRPRLLAHCHAAKSTPLRRPQVDSDLSTFATG